METAEGYLRGTITNVVVTVPAYSNDSQQATLEPSPVSTFPKSLMNLLPLPSPTVLRKSLANGTC